MSGRSLTAVQVCQRRRSALRRRGAAACRLRCAVKGTSGPVMPPAARLAAVPRPGRWGHDGPDTGQTVRTARRARAGRSTGTAPSATSSTSRSGFRRVTTEIVLVGGGLEGRGEDVTYAAEDHDDYPADLPLAGEWTLDGFSRHLGGLDLFPARPPGEEFFRPYRRWGFESAALDLALRQRKLGLGEALGAAGTGRCGSCSARGSTSSRGSPSTRGSSSSSTRRRSGTRR